MKQAVVSQEILDSLLEGFQIIDFNWNYLYVNPAVATHAQTSVEYLVGNNMMACFPGIEKTVVYRKLKKAMKERVKLQFENLFFVKEGVSQWFDIRVEPIPQGIIVLSCDCTQRKIAELELIQLKNDLEKKVIQRTAKLEKLVKEKDVILKEMHHRVKNNLQIISSLIRLQMEEEGEDTNGVLELTQSRIETIAEIHESLYQFKNLALIDVAKHWKTLFGKCLSSLVHEPANYQLQLDLQEIKLGVDRMIPLGLLINELITNSIIHGFKGRKKGRISIELLKSGEEYRLTYKDDGVGMTLKTTPPEDNTKHIGLFLIDGFVEQLDGTIQLIPSKVGVHFEIRFPVS